MPKSPDDSASDSSEPNDRRFYSLGNDATHVPDALGATSAQSIEAFRNEAAIASRYDVHEELGRGGMGQVYKATDRSIGRTVAIKRVLANLLGDQSAIDRFTRETKLAGALNHPYIVLIYDTGSTSLGPFLVMEYVNGGSLLSLCRNQPLPLKDVLRYAIQVCRALEATHAQGIVHRDIKPSNILLQQHIGGSQWVAKLTDFGLARGDMQGQMSLMIPTQRGQILGTLDYMSPEQAAGSSSVDGRADIFALGTTLYHLLTGRSPRQMRLDKLPSEMQSLIARATEYDPADRYGSVNELREDLHTILNQLKGTGGGDFGGTVAASSSELAAAQPSSEDSSAKIDVSKYPQQSLSAPLGQEFRNTLGTPFRWISPGDFLMGNERSVDEVISQFPELKHNRGFVEASAPPHRVQITKGYYLSQYPVTRSEFAKFVEKTGHRTEGEVDGRGAFIMKGSKREQDPSRIWRSPGFKQSDRDAVVCISWNDAQAYCRWLSTLENRSYCLPTEAEWEYACRAGTTTAFSFGATLNDIGEYCWYWDNSFSWYFAKKVHPVGMLKPNAWGLYDMHGNVWEWCNDWYDSYTAETVTNPQGAQHGSERVFRGGSWEECHATCRSAARGGSLPSFREVALGFRVALRV
jgi:formylglycine-generating enzyme required for sulfatase activity